MLRGSAQIPRCGPLPASCSSAISRIAAIDERLDRTAVEIAAPAERLCMFEQVPLFLSYLAGAFFIETVIQVSPIFRYPLVPTSCHAVMQ
jgi:hypothetical protein